MNMERVPMTQDAYNRLRSKIDQMENVEMPAIADRIAAARAEGDLKENAEYHAQREAQGMLQARINELKSRMARAAIVDPSKIPQNEVAFGATVTVMDVDLDEEEKITLVGDGDEDYDAGKYLITSPIGRGLLGKKKGELVKIDVPKGVISFKVLDISYEGSNESE